MMSGGTMEKITDQEEVGAKVDEAPESAGSEQEREKPKQPPPKKKTFSGVSFKIPYRIIIVVLAIAAAGTGATMVYFQDQENHVSAVATFREAEALLEKRQYKKAGQLFASSQAALDDILVLHRSERDALAAKISDTVNSQSFQEGLQGRVLYEGEYVSVEAARAKDSFNSHMRTAEQASENGSFTRAIEAYEKALAFAEQAGYQDQQADIRRTVKVLHVDQAIAQAQQAEEEQSWQQAADAYQQALELSVGVVSPEKRSDIATRQAKVSLRHNLEEGRQAFSASQWERTVTMLQKAEQILTTAPEIATTAEKEEIGKLLVDARLFQLLAQAKQEYEAFNWDRAVAIYDQAIALLEQNTALLGEEETADSIGKIKRTILMTRIAGTQKEAVNAEEKDNLEESRRLYLALIAMIQGSDFADDDQLQTILDNVRQQEVRLEKELTVNKRKDWLLENYEEIFRKHYPSARSSELLNPKVRFVKRQDDVLIFTLSCVERQQGRPFSLQLNYQYDLKNDKWSLFSGSL
jgi:hypothetical protein